MKQLRVSALASALAVQLAGAEVHSFDDARPGEPPPGWVAAITGEGTPQWTVAADDSAPTRPHVLRQSAWTPKPSFPLCIKADSSLRDGFVEVKFKAVGGTNDQAAGLVWHYRNPENYYVARANALEDNVVLYKVVSGKRTALDIVGRAGGYGVKAKVPPRKWNTLRVDFVGPRFRVALNGGELFAVEDATFGEAGAVGVWTKADSVTLFDDFRYGTDKP